MKGLAMFLVLLMGIFSHFLVHAADDLVGIHPVVGFTFNHFYRGNLHTHTNRSDGDAPPEQVIAAYRDAGYDFLAVTDHNIKLDKSEFSTLESDSFKLIEGEEVSDAVPSFHPPEYYTRPYVSVHGNALCSKQRIGGQLHQTTAEAVLNILERMRAVAPTVQLNHPNYESALTLADLLPIQGSYLLEIANQHPYVNNEGVPQWPGDERISMEDMWDRLLSAGQRVYGTATDDSHDLFRDPGFNRRLPMQGWVQVAASELSDVAICGALAAGDFYASNGVSLSSIQYDGKFFSIQVDVPAEEEEPVESMRRFTTLFIGKDGRILKMDESDQPQYELTGSELYVRAVVMRQDGKKAWVQPVFPDRTYSENQ